MIQDGTPQQIYNNPVNLYCAKLFGEYNLINLNEYSSPVTLNKTNLNGQLFIRPEQIQINATAHNSLKGIVNKILYYGSYNTLDVTTGRQTVKVRTNHNSYAEGDVIYLDLSAGEVWDV